MSLLNKVLADLHEEAAEGAMSAGDVAGVRSGIGHGFTRGDQELGSERRGKKKKIKKYLTIKNPLKEEQKLDTADILAKIKSSEQQADKHKSTVGFALELDDNQIVKVYVDSEEAKDFEGALSRELSKNEEDDFKHRDLGEVLYDLKDDFNIVNVIWPEVEEDEEESEKVTPGEGGEGNLDSEFGADSKPADDEGMDPGVEGGEGEPPVDMEDDGAKSVLNSVIDMMKADAEARKADAEAKKAEAEAKESSYAAKAAETKLKQEEDVLDMEAYNKQQADVEKEAKKLSQLAKYKHDIKQDSGSVDDIELGDREINVDKDVDINVSGTEEEEHRLSSNVASAVLELLRNRGDR